MKIYEDRKYQSDCVIALLSDVLSSKDCHPLAAVPTGGGKTIILCRLIKELFIKYPDLNVLVISHTENILMQDYEALVDFFPDIFIGLYSSGLQSKTKEQITVAGIQSIYKKGKNFREFDLCIIDEAHSCPTKGRGMYWQFFDKTSMQRVGLTATHFRTGHGYLHKGKGAWFNKLSYDLCTMDSFNKLVKDNYLCKLFSKPPDLQLDVDKVKVTAGDYNLKDLASTVDRNAITKEAVQELIKFGHNYKSWLVFAINIDHANNIYNELKDLGIVAEVLHSFANGDRHVITNKFKNGNIRALVTVGMLTTGFDAPNTDLICLLRPTKSPVLHVQMIGRGSRSCDGKDHCLVLDFAGNITRLGPINNVQVPIKGKKKGPGESIVKTCPDCGCLHHPTVKICDVCNHVFVFKEKITPKFDQSDVVQTNTEKWLNVTNVEYKIHSKKDKPDSLRVIYRCGLYTVSEYVCYDHTGYPRHSAENWVRQRFDYNYIFQDVQELFEKSEYLQIPSQILVDISNKYPNIIDAKIN